MSTDPLVDVLGLEKSDAATVSYLDHLRSLSLSALDAEDKLLEETHATLSTSLVQLARANQGLFSFTKSNLDTFREAFGSIASVASEPEGHAKEAKEALDDFLKLAPELTVRKQNASLLARHIDDIIDILEIPSLIRTCVKNGYYAEAMDLYSHINRLVARFTDVPLITDVFRECSSAMREMNSRLLTLLRGPLKLGPAIKVVSYLRRIGNLESPVVDAIFLYSRLTYFRSLVHGLDQLSADQWLKRYLEVFREQAFGMISMYKSVFPSGDPRLLSSFAKELIRELECVVDACLPRIKDTSTLYTQFLYCATSMARLHADFTLLIAPKFEHWMAGMQRHRELIHKIDAGRLAT